MGHAGVLPISMVIWPMGTGVDQGELPYAYCEMAIWEVLVSCMALPVLGQKGMLRAIL
jgi:hypothetical protein